MMMESLRALTAQSREEKAPQEWVFFQCTEIPEERVEGWCQGLFTSASKNYLASCISHK